jgi:hypothetical protein
MHRSPADSQIHLVQSPDAGKVLADAAQFQQTILMEGGDSFLDEEISHRRMEVGFDSRRHVQNAARIIANRRRFLLRV